MLRKKIRRRPETASLIKFKDFIQCRAEKEKIINNPFQQNWKKAIVIEELLALYKPHQGGNLPNSSPYNKTEYNLYWPFRNKNQCENQDNYWYNNEESQLKKLYKMADGIEKWEENFQDIRIQKIADLVHKRERNPHDTNTMSTHSESRKPYKFKRKTGVHQHFKQNYVQKIGNLLKKSKPSFLEQKRQIQRYQQIAINQYGLKINKNLKIKQPTNMTDNFIKKDKEIFEKFKNSIESSRTSHYLRQQKPQINQSQDLNFGIVPVWLRKGNRGVRSVDYSPNRGDSCINNRQAVHKKRYLRIGCD